MGLFFILMFLFILIPIPTSILAFIFMLMDNKNSKRYLFLFCLGVSLIALYYTPSMAQDGFRIMYEINDWRGFGNITDLFTSLSSNHQEESTYPVFSLLMYLVSRTGSDTYISGISMFGTLFCSLFPLIDSLAKRRIGKIQALISSIAIIMWINYLYVVSGMRFYLAISLLLLIVYENLLVEKKNYIQILYVIPICIHPGVTPIVIIAVVTSIIKKDRMMNRLISLFLLPIVIYISNFLNGHVSIYYLNLMFSKIIHYASNDSYSELMGESFFIRLWASIFVIIVFLYWYYVFVKGTMNKYYIFVQYTVLFTLGSAPFYNLGDRNISAAILLVIMVVSLNLFKTNLEKNKTEKKIVGEFIIVMIIIIGIMYNSNNIRYLILNKQISSLIMNGFFNLLLIN